MNFDGKCFKFRIIPVKMHNKKSRSFGIPPIDGMPLYAYNEIRKQEREIQNPIQLSLNRRSFEFDQEVGPMYEVDRQRQGIAKPEMAI